MESLRNVPYLAIGKHLCGPATGNLHLFNYEACSRMLNVNNYQLHEIASLTASCFSN